MNENRQGRLDLLVEGLGEEILDRLEENTERPGLKQALEPALREGLGLLDLPREPLFRQTPAWFKVLFG